MQHLIDMARKGDKDGFKTALKEQLSARKEAFLSSAKQAMIASIGQKK